MRTRTKALDITTPAVIELWWEFVRTRSPEIRATLVTLYRPLVRRYAIRLHNSLPACVELDDLISVGTVGLAVVEDRSRFLPVERCRPRAERLKLGPECRNVKPTR